MQDRKRLLARIDLFSGLGERELDEVAQIARWRRLAAGEVLFRKGEDGSELYVLASGVLKAYVTGPEGGGHVFRHMGPGDVVGELAVFAEGKRTANVTAVDDSELLMIQRRDLIPLLRRVPEIGIRLLHALARRTVQLSEALEDASLQPVSVRLAKSLLRFAERWGQPDEAGGILISMRLPQGELGELVGSSREHVNKVLGRWAELGILAMSGGRITIKKKDALETHATGENGEGDGAVEEADDDAVSASRARSDGARRAARRKMAPD